jgi:hypothetical protein
MASRSARSLVYILIIKDGAQTIDDRERERERTPETFWKGIKEE